MYYTTSPHSLDTTLQGHSLQLFRGGWFGHGGDGSFSHVLKANSEFLRDLEVRVFFSITDNYLRISK